MTIDDVAYDLPTLEDMTLDEIAAASAMGAKLPTKAEEAMDGAWIKALVVTAKRRAGEKVDAATVGEIRFGAIDWTANGDDGGEQNGDPPTSRAARRSKSGGNNAKKRNGA